ncbi:hypothetical protein ACXWOO_11970, partial [Streptococcus pyogenes]
ADALKACFQDLPHFWNFTYTVVACADTPLITSQELETLFSALKNNSELVGVAATFDASNPKGLGRILRSGKGFKII